MDPVALIEQAREAGLKLSVAEGRLLVRGPKRLSPLVALIAENKQEVIEALLATPDAARFDRSLTVGVTETPKIAEKQMGFADRGAAIGRRKGGLIGCGFPAHATEVPSDSILAKPPQTCPRCCSRPVLSELRTITGGLCWDCWEARQ